MASNQGERKLKADKVIKKKQKKKQRNPRTDK